jgi:hypothetical protein
MTLPSFQGVDLFTITFAGGDNTADDPDTFVSTPISVPGLLVGDTVVRTQDCLWTPFELVISVNDQIQQIQQANFIGDFFTILLARVKP